AIFGQEKGIGLLMPFEVRSTRAVITKGARQLRQVVGVGSNHATFSSRDRLPRVEGKSSHLAERARMVTFVPAVKTTRRILHNEQAMLPRDIHDGVHIGGESK